MASIFLTGGTGFLGSHLADALVREGHRVTASVRRTSDTQRLGRLGVEQVDLDLGGTSVELAAHDAVVHCGALTRARSEAEFIAVNATGTRRLARAAAEAGVRRFVFISSLAARGPDGAGGPVSPYGRSKAVAEEALESIGGPMEIVVLRPGGVYGPRDTDLLPLFRLAARGWVVVPRSAAPLQPVFAADVVDAVLAALKATPASGPLHIAGPSSRSWGKVAHALMAGVARPGRVLRAPAAVFLSVGLVSEFAARLTGTAPAMDRRRARDLAIHAWTCDIEPSEAALAPWRPQVDLDEGLATTAAWYRRRGWL